MTKVVPLPDLLTAEPETSLLDRLIPGRYRRREEEMVAASVAAFFAEHGPVDPTAFTEPEFAAGSVVEAKIQAGSITETTFSPDAGRWLREIRL